MTTSPKTPSAPESATPEPGSMNRRRIIRGLAGAGTVAVWSTPTVMSVVLPAHAQASVLPGAGASSSTSGGSTSSSTSSGGPEPGAGSTSSTSSTGGGGTSSTSSTGGSTSSTSSSGGSTSGSSTSSTGGSTSSSSGGSGTNTCNGEKGEIVFNTAFHEFSNFGEGRDNFAVANTTQYDVTDLQWELTGPQASFFNLSNLPTTLPAGTSYSPFGISWTGEDCGSLNVKAVALLTVTGRSCGEEVRSTMDVFANCS